MELTIATYLLLFFIFLAFSALISALETSFIGVRKTRIRHLAQSGSKAAAEVEKITDNPEKFLATVLFSNNLVQAAAATAGTIIAIKLLGDNWGSIAATIGIAIATLLLAEAIPKTFAAQHTERVALALARPFRIIEKILSPVGSALSWLTCRITGCSIPAGYQLSEDEIRTIISTGRDEGTVEETKADMLEQVFEFADRSVRTVSTPRTEVSWLEYGATLGDFFTIYSQTLHSRYPVYEGSIENVKGMISIKDVLLAQANNTLTRDSSLNDIIRPVYFAPENKPIGELFNEMKTKGNQMTIVVDEFGAVSGIVTLQQLVEEIVGEMKDELAKGSKPFHAIDEKTFQVDGSMRIEEVNELLGLNIPEGEYETVAGFILFVLGRIPKQGEQLRTSGLRMAIVEMRGLKIEKVLISKE